MDRIDPLGGGIPYNKPKKKKVGTQKTFRTRPFSSLIGTKAAEENGSAEELSNSESTGTDAELEILLDAVHQAGEALGGSPTMHHIKDYRSSIQEFLRHATKRLLELENRVSGFNVLKRKRFTLIKIVNEKVEKLIQEVLRGQQEKLAILERVNEIGGLLIDLIT